MAAENNVQSIRGMNDLLPGQIETWQRVEAVVREVSCRYGYREIRTPIVERTELFRRSIGEQTDIVEKEMYTFTDNNGDSLTLRPEATASCVRAGNEHGLLHNQTQRLWYVGPMFRHERPQKGRYRQFHQFGIEALGWAGSDIEAEVIAVGERLWRCLGIRGLTLEINSLGSVAARANFRDALKAYLSDHVDALDTDSQRRLERNPLRILDSKDQGTQEVLNSAPSLSDFLEKAEQDNFERLQRLLTTVNIAFSVNTRLVRGLDYYTGLVFEWTTDQLGTQSAICAGGRYDGLVEQLGGRPAPAAGFACGLERLIELVTLQGEESPIQSPRVFVAALGDIAELEAIRYAESLRDAGVDAQVNCGQGNLKKQLRRADNSGAQVAVIIDDESVDTSTVKMKPLRGQGEQSTVPATELLAAVRSITD
ncbi:MAG: histidine--tRNA ligase [Proteobacteria bacterium TMED51]|jgi:histidyl-tRNA synthetase|nr:MAG: histidine--tRNA ligase [Proteobacteria bacterium TMED51]